MGPQGGWEVGTGVLTLPSGRTVRGRSLLAETPVPPPTYALYLGGRRAPDVEWESAWVEWPDFRLPRDRTVAAREITNAWVRLEGDRVEVACRGGRGRTGTVLACLSVLDGLDGDAAIDYVRSHYDRRAIETPWQKRYVVAF